MPGGNRCCVALCKIYSKTAKASDKPVMFFRFPKDKRIRKEWIEKCSRKDKWNPDTGRICSLHFTKDDYEDALKAELLNLTPKKLKPTAVPSLYLPHRKTAVSKPKERKTQFIKQKERQIIVDEIIKAAEESTKVDDATEDNLEKIRQLEETVESLRTENETIKKRLTSCEKKLNTEMGKSQSLYEQIVSLKQQLAETKKGPSFEDRVKSAFKGTLTPNQVDLILKKKTQVWWTRDELKNALALRYLSVGCYNFLKDELNYPVPGLSTLRRWASSLQKQDEEILRLEGQYLEEQLKEQQKQS